MIRVALIIIGFFGMTLTLILMQPPVPILTSTEYTTDRGDNVTRSNTDYDAMIDASGSSVYEQVTTLPGRAIPALSPETQTQAQGQMPTPTSPALVNDAATKGLVKVSGERITADGRVDTSTLLKVLSKSPDAMHAGGTLYTVQAGDSLASIAYRFYGTTRRVDTLVEANTAVIAPSGFTVGQELVIPPT